MKKLGFLITMLVITSLPAWSQGAKSIRITEVMTDNRTNLVDEYGQHKPWVELSNSSFTTYNVRGMFLTTDRRVLDKKMSPEARRQLMCPLPNNEPRTTLGGKKSIVIFDSSSWYLDGRNSDNKVVSNPNIGYGLRTIRYADGKTQDFYKVGISANTTEFATFYPL